MSPRRWGAPTGWRTSAWGNSAASRRRPGSPRPSVCIRQPRLWPCCHELLAASTAVLRAFPGVERSRPRAEAWLAYAGVTADTSGLLGYQLGRLCSGAHCVGAGREAGCMGGGAALVDVRRRLHCRGAPRPLARRPRRRHWLPWAALSYRARVPGAGSTDTQQAPFKCPVFGE